MPKLLPLLLLLQHRLILHIMLQVWLHSVLALRYPLIRLCSLLLPLRLRLHLHLPLRLPQRRLCLVLTQAQVNRFCSFLLNPLCV